MTTKLSTNGHVLIPKALRQEKKLVAGDDFEVLTTVRGDIILRRVRRSKHSLVQHLRRLKDLGFERRDDPIPPLSLSLRLRPDLPV